MKKNDVLGKERNLEREFQDTFATILGHGLPVDNPRSFFEQAIKDLVSLSAHVQRVYMETHGDTTLSGKELEDTAFAYFHLPAVEPYLEEAGKKLDVFNQLQAFIKNKLSTISEVITPSGHFRIQKDRGGSVFETKLIVNRLQVLLYILRNNAIDLDHVTMEKGILTPGMMRQESYISVDIPVIHRLVHVCDEVGNATYVFDSQVLLQLNISNETLNELNKEEKNELISANPGVGVRFMQTPKWTSEMEELLFSDDLRQHALTKEATSVPRVSQSELDPWKGFWTDEHDKHWGPINRIICKLPYISRTGIESILK